MGTRIVGNNDAADVVFIAATKAKLTGALNSVGAYLVLEPVSEMFHHVLSLKSVYELRQGAQGCAIFSEIMVSHIEEDPNYASLAVTVDIIGSEGLCREGSALITMINESLQGLETRVEELRNVRTYQV